MLGSMRQPQLRLAGDRFGRGQLPLEFLRDLAALGDALREVAKEIYLSRNPERRRIPNGFAERISPAITAVGRGSTLLTIGPQPAAEHSYIQTTLLDVNSGYLADAWDRIIGELEGGLGVPLPASSDDGVAPGAWRTKLRRFGAGLREGEVVAFLGSGGREVHYDREVRRRYLLSRFPDQRYTERMTVTGRIYGVDSVDRSFHIRLTDGHRVEAETPPEYRGEVRDAWTAFDQGLDTEVNIQCEAELDGQGRPAVLRDITEITLLHPLDIDRQIERLRRIRPGWLDGEGEALDPAGLSWLHEALLSRIAFSDATLPRLYPTEDGGVQAEWTLGTISVDLCIDLDSRQAVWGWSDLSSDKDGEDELDLNKETDWQWLSARLTESPET